MISQEAAPTLRFLDKYRQPQARRDRRSSPEDPAPEDEDEAEMDVDAEEGIYATDGREVHVDREEL